MIGDEGWPALFDQLPLAWWETDRELRVQRYGGGSAGHALGTGDVHPPPPASPAERREGPPVHDTVTQAVALSGKTVRWQAHSAGRLLDVAAGPRHDQGGIADGVRAVAVDVSPGVYERERHLAFAAYFPGAAFIRDPAGRFLWANDAYAHLHGMTPAELTGRTLEHVLRAPDLSRTRRLDQQVLALGRPFRHSMAFDRERGGPVRVVGHRFPLETAAGRCVGGIYLDVTDHMTALGEKEAVEEELRALRDRTGAAAVTFTTGGRIMRATPGAAELLHTTVAGLEGMTLPELVEPSDDADRLLRQWRDLVRGRALRRSTRLACRTSRGGRRLIHADMAVVREGGRPCAILTLLTALGVEHARSVELTPIQEQVLLRLARGESNARIARDLRMSRQALDYHLRRLRKELDAPSRPAIVARGYALGLLDGTTWPPELSLLAHARRPDHQ
ncbi:PAS domain-containing protein [Streptomyces sp. NPDC057271]|uniref:PAS domain-containing protein n=1 Tax=unclassified Streptomyces TaxID=2593676 RepID=UPI00362D8E45